MPGLNWMKAFYILTGFVLTLLLGIFLGRRRAKANKEPSRENHSMSTPANLFDEREKELIRLIFENSSKSISTSIDDINLVLGLAGRPVDVQKKHRSDITISINKKFCYLTNGNRLLLKKSRTEVDKRTFEFYIEFDDYAMLGLPLDIRQP